MNTPTLRSLLATASALFLLAGLSIPALGSASDEQYFVNAINSERAAVGAPPLSVDGSLVAYARSHSQWMIANGFKHSTNLGADLSGWSQLGENIGMGGNRESLHAQFMASSGHRANLLNPIYDKVGVGVVYSGDGVPYVTQIFMDTAGSPPPTTPPPPTTQPAPPPTTAPPAPKAPAPRQSASPTTTAPPAPEEPEPPAEPRFNEEIVRILLPEDVPNLKGIGDVTEAAQEQAAGSAATSPWLI